VVGSDTFIRVFTHPLRKIGLRLHHAAFQGAVRLEGKPLFRAGIGIQQGANQHDKLDYVHIILRVVLSAEDSVNLDRSERPVF
jgi:hypothetical protein